MKKRPVRIFHTDGGVANNGNYGYQRSVICGVEESTGTVLFFKPAGDKTNNEAELLAILELIHLTPTKTITIKSDSLLAVNLINKRWHTKIDRLKSLLEKIWSTEKHIRLLWIPREENKAGIFIEEKTGL